MASGTNWYGIAADVVLVAHAAFIAFVIFGLLLTVIGLVARWRWVRSFWFRAAHLAAILVVVAQAWAGVLCPLTILENHLRQQAGRDAYESSFVAHWLHAIIFYEAEPWVFAVIYTAFGSLVVLTWILGRPRWPRRRTERSD